MSTPAQSPPRRRGRPRKFEHAAALDAALRTFWTRGYGGTSLDDLTAAMGMNRPSIYAAFGNKDAVYAAAVEHYVATIGARYVEPLADARLVTALMGFYRNVVDVVTGRHGPLGCIVACTLPAEAGTSAAARRQLANVLGRVDRAIHTRLVAARRAGELPPDADLGALAQAVTSGMLAISIRARAGASRAELFRLARSFVRMVAAGAVSAPASAAARSR